LFRVKTVKTNVLDAIYHLSYGKSYFNPLAVQNIKHGEEFFVDAEFIKMRNNSL
jgi:DNA replication and repair protein RecF